MTWIALRLTDRVPALPSTPGPGGADAPLPRGALLAAFRYHPAEVPVNLLR